MNANLIQAELKPMKEITEKDFANTDQKDIYDEVRFPILLENARSQRQMVLTPRGLVLISILSLRGKCVRPYSL